MNFFNRNRLPGKGIHAEEQRFWLLLMAAICVQTKFTELTMNTAKEEVKLLLEKLPDKCTLEDVQYHLYVVEKIQRGIARAESESTLSQEDVERKFSSKWTTPRNGLRKQLKILNRLPSISRDSEFYARAVVSKILAGKCSHRPCWFPGSAAILAVCGRDARSPGSRM